MAKATEENDIKGHRGPLGIRVPLLAAVIVAASGVTGFQVAGAISRSWSAEPISVRIDEPAPAVETPAPAVVDPTEQLIVEVVSGDTLDTIFRENNISLVDLAQVLQLDDARRNLRILKPGDTLRVRHEDGKLLEIERPIDFKESLLVERGDEGFRATIERLPIEHRVVTATGLINSSLFEAAAAARVSERLVMKVAEIFAWDVDFVRDIGAGDEFTVVYEELWRDGVKLGEGNLLAAEFVNRGARYTAIRFEEGEGQAGYYTAEGKPMRKSFVRAPLSFTRISSDFNPRRRHPILNAIRAHRGVDYAAPTGTPVKSSGDGKIIFRGWKGGYGNTVIVQHAGNVTTLYGHLSRFDKTNRYGSRVKQGEVIGYVGATGLATAAHLHYEYRKNGVHLNPRTVILPDAEPLRGRSLTAFQTEAQPLLARLSSNQGVLASNRRQH